MNRYLFTMLSKMPEPSDIFMMGLLVLGFCGIPRVAMTLLMLSVYCIPPVLGAALYVYWKRRYE